MTCIVALKTPRGVILGGDSAGVEGYTLGIRTDEKVFSRMGGGAKWTFGFTSSFRMGQLIRYSLKIPKVPKNKNLQGYMATKFINACRDCFKTGGQARKHNEEESAGIFIAAVRGQIFTIYEDYQIGQATEDFVAVGCGGQIARGSLYTSPDHWEPKNRVIAALSAAEYCSAGVRSPFHLVLENGKEEIWQRNLGFIDQTEG